MGHINSLNIKGLEIYMYIIFFFLLFLFVMLVPESIYLFHVWREVCMAVFMGRAALLCSALLCPALPEQCVKLYFMCGANYLCTLH